MIKQITLSLFIIVFSAQHFENSVLAQLSQASQDRLSQLANKDISIQLSNINDKKNQESTLKALSTFVQAGQILSYFNQDSQQASKVCQWLSSLESKHTNVEFVFLKAEGLRLFKCKEEGLKSSVSKEVQAILSTQTELQSISDYFNAFMLQKRAKHYGVENPSNDFFNKFIEVLDKKWIDGFDSEKFNLKSEQSGVSLDSIKIVEMISSILKHQTLGERATKTVQKSLAKLIKSASALSNDNNSENQIFFVAPRGAYNPQQMDLTQINFHVLNILIESKKAINLQNIKFEPNYFTLYRNYFQGKAISAVSTQTAFYALRGLKSLQDQICLQDSNNKNYIVFDGSKNTLSYDSLDVFNSPSQIKSLRLATLINLNQPEKTQDITSRVSLKNDGKNLVVDFDNVKDLDWTSYAIVFETENAQGQVSFNTKLFSLINKISENVDVSFSQTVDLKYPEKYQYNDGYPRVFEQLNTNENPILHLQITAQLQGGKDIQNVPQNVYITLQKENQLPFTVHADYIQSIKRFQVIADLRVLIKEQINGDYMFKVHVSDPRASEQIVKDLGVFQVNFNEGSNEASNFGVRDDFKLFDKITNYFPPEPPAKSSLIPLLSSAFLVFLFVFYVFQLLQNKANLSNISVWGFVFLLNYLGILGIIVAFWLKVNLVNTLWTLLAVSPVTIFTMNLGLTPENCQITEFSRPASTKGKRAD